MTRQGAENGEPREPLFGWRTLAAVVSLGPMWFGIALTDWLDSAPGSLWVTVAMVWTWVVVGWVIVRPVAWWLGWKWPAWLNLSLVNRLRKGRFGFLLRWFRWLRLPPFSVSYAVCACALLAFIAWIVMDAQFPSALHFALIDLGLRPHGADPAFVAAGLWDTMWRGVHEWNALGLRIAVLFVLSLVGVVSGALMVVRMFLGPRGLGRSLRGWMLAVLLLAGWLGLVVSYERMHWWGVQRRVRSVLPRFQAAAAPLIEEWPTEQGTLPGAGGFYAYPVKLPNTILLYERRGYPVRETFGHEVSRTEHGGLRFDLDSAYDCMIEYHPPTSTPDSHVDPFGYTRLEVRNIVRLEDHWYLVRYEASRIDDND